MIGTSLEDIKTLKREGKFTKAVQIIDAILPKLDSTQKHERVELLIWKSYLLRLEGNFEEAEKTAQEAYCLARKTSINTEGEGWILMELGIVHFDGFFSLEKAENYLNQARAIFNKLNVQKGLVYPLVIWVVFSI